MNLLMRVHSKNVVAISPREITVSFDTQKISCWHFYVNFVSWIVQVQSLRISFQNLTFLFCFSY